MDDLISRQAAIDAIKRDIWDKHTAKDAIDAICNIPSAQPEIIHCKKCLWWERIEGTKFGYCHACKHGFVSKNWEISIYRKYSEDWFCADGERKDNEVD